LAAVEVPVNVAVNVAVFSVEVAFPIDSITVVIEVIAVVAVEVVVFADFIVIEIFKEVVAVLLKFFCVNVVDVVNGSIRKSLSVFSVFQQ